ncbi:MAG: PQQ-binding-like beta-propeller repeat protein, partial [Terriglobales bacterium]
MKRIRFSVLILSACFVSVAWGKPPACTAHTPWVEFHRYNMQRWNQCENLLSVSTVGNLGLKWSFTTSDYVFSSPAVVSAVVYVGSDDDNVYALNATTGAKLWSFTTGNVVGSSPAVADGVVYVNSYDKNVYALNASTGTTLWNSSGGGFSSPTVVN